MKCNIITGTSFVEVEQKINRFLMLNRIKHIEKIVNMSDEHVIAVAIFYNKILLTGDVQNIMK